MRLPKEVTPLLTKMSEVLDRLFGINLVGFYVYGSVLEAAFDPAHSDVDCIAVTKRPLTDLEFRELNDWLHEAAATDPWVKRLQVSFLIKSSVLAEDKDACLLQFGVLKRSGSDGNPIVWLDFFERGRTLRGAAPESFLPRITPAIFYQALVREVAYLQQQLCVRPDGAWRDRLSYRIYAVLTLCRILFSLRTGKVASKEHAARWAIDHLPEDWHDLIHQALEGEASDIPIARLCGFVQYARAQLQSTRPVSVGANGA